MALRRLGAGDYRRMPWKNGGGETIEIAVWPPQAGLDTFDWRVSLAHVGANGPFSVFPGIERTLAVVEGAGIDLVFADRRVLPLTPRDLPIAFPADVPVSGRLHRGPITDLNVMSRRGRVSHAVTRLVAPRALDLAPGAIALLYCHDGGATTGTGQVLAPGDTCILDVTTPIAAGRSEATFLVELRPEGPLRRDGISFTPGVSPERR